MKSKSERRLAWCLIAVVFAALAVVGGVNASADTAVPAVDMAAEYDGAQQVAVANERSILRGTLARATAVPAVDPARCPGGNCAPQQPQVAPTPQFDFEQPEPSGVGAVAIVLGVIGSVVVGVVTGVAVQWKATHSPK